MSQQPPVQGGPSSNQRPGQMTAVMRAMPQITGPKVLRIGVVQGGKVIEERVIKNRTNVTVGPSEKSMFVVASPNVPPNHRLFELVGADYHLNFLDGMTGRVALQTGISDLAALRGQAKKNAQGAYQIRLTEDARGKVVVGDTTFLFQFVAPPPIAPKPQLPVSVKGGLASNIDWTLTIIAAFSFLFHFGMVGALYSDWMDPVVDDDVNIADLLSQVRSLPPPPPVETPKEEAGDKKADDGKKADAPTPTNTKAASAEAAAGAKAKATAALNKSLDQLEVGTLGALTASGPAVQGVMRGSEAAIANLDQVAASSAGVGAGGANGLRMNTGGGGPVAVGQGGNGLGGVGQTTAGTPGGAGAVAKVEGPKGDASMGGLSVAGGKISNADRVVAGMRARFRACYNNGLANNPDQEGTIRIVTKIGPNGEVQSASPSVSGNLGGDVVACVVGRVKGANFDPPDGGSAVVTIPVTFKKQ